MVDSISDMITRIRNAQRASLLTVKTPYSKFRKDVLDVIYKEGYVDTYEVYEIKKGIKEIAIKLKYAKDGKPVIQKIKKVSRPGRRYYTSVAEMKPVYNNLGIAIISTPSGVMTDSEARKKNIGGEVICELF